LKTKTKIVDAKIVNCKLFINDDIKISDLVKRDTFGSVIVSPMKVSDIKKVKGLIKINVAKEDKKDKVILSKMPSFIVKRYEKEKLTNEHFLSSYSIYDVLRKKMGKKKCTECMDIYDKKTYNPNVITVIKDAYEHVSGNSNEKHKLELGFNKSLCLKTIICSCGKKFEMTLSVEDRLPNDYILGYLSFVDEFLVMDFVDRCNNGSK
jgi:hypothetical protein